MAPSDQKDNKKQAGTHEHPSPQEQKASDKAAAEAAHQQAEDDMDKDPDFSAHSPNDDLDEGETARLGEDDNPIT